jgi:hypothetical protein
MAVFVMVSSFALLACPSDDEDEIIRDISATVPASSTTVVAAQGQDLTLPSGAVFNAGAQPLNVRFVSPSQATIGRTGGPVATSTVTFASCTFMITATSFPLGQGPQVGQTFTFPTCNFMITANDVEVGGDEVVGTLVLVLVGPTGSATSNAIAVEVRINDDGLIVINDVTTTVDSDVTGTTGTTGG